MVTPATDVLEALARFEAGTRRRRIHLTIGVIAIVASFSFLCWQLLIQHRAAAEAADEQTRRADNLQHALTEAQEALRRGDRARVDRVLQAAQGQTRDLGASALSQDELAQVPLEQLDVHLWICAGSAPANRDRAIAFSTRHLAAVRDWQRRYLQPETNAQPSFRVVRNEIRYNPGEAAAAARLEQMIRQSLGVEVARVATFYPSPQSISIFFCEGANPPLPAANRNNAAAEAVGR